MDIVSLLMSSFGGGLTGLLGGAVQKIFDYKTKKLEIEMAREKFTHDVALRKVDAEIMAQEWAARTKVAEIETEGKIEVEDAKAFAIAKENEDKNYLEYLDKLTPAQDWLFVLLEFAKGAVTPGLTLYLCAITTIIYLKAAKLLNGDIILPGMAYDMVSQIINTVLYLTTTACMYAFGIRNREKRK